MLKIKTFKLTPKQIRRHDKAEGADAYAFYRRTIDQHYIVIPHHASTKTRLHELGHCIKGHCITAWSKSPILITEYIAQEIEADFYAFEKCCKPVSLVRLADIAFQSMRYGFHANDSFIETLKVCAHHNIPLNKHQRSLFWQTLKDYQKAGKPKTFENPYF
jgi:hypothetical protein